jgi:HEPN domain-containing protein
MTATLAEEWVSKAEQDYYSVLALKRQRKHPVPDAICFLCQQCAEKYLKAFLVSRKAEPPKIHYLDRLNDLCTDIDPEFTLLEDASLTLNPFAVEFRYPGEKAEPSDVERAIRAMEQVREFVRARLGLAAGKPSSPRQGGP